ncbi:SusC/RagA family TonB-linked outer membrane protein [Chitinophaga nivalis]|uniref:SusC/RagA family TonB-linked outer membrane protein n=1 Tax=Chitinophaga nivalis TaxID=2991709 RepID=A0ABT3IF55_9BACT|nr:SusC/RagA family TonB-linked outer membrane protein [Chitinophaga nivalis]MCW3467725.1 SusC/RagA family TonB-linked outer membrane protein [Chitinophaga nivalis]MCW3482583.1 SusC/RagA family TonB-linked outer membrane protein [Chitinophaga nivalis]
MRKLRFGVAMMLGYAIASTPAYAATQKTVESLYPQADDMPLSIFLSNLEANMGVRFSYNAALLKDKKISPQQQDNIRAKGIDPALNMYLQPFGLTAVKTSDRFYVIKSAVVPPVPATSKSADNLTTAVVAAQTVQGTVTDAATGTPLPGVTVHVKGTATGAVTTANGTFVIREVPENAILVFSFIGYQQQEITLNNRTQLQVSLVEEKRALSEVVVTALGIKREEKSLGYAVQKIGGDAVQTVKGVDIATSLTGKVSGLVVKNSTEFFEKPTLELRGENPLLVIDGIPYASMSLRDISPDDIQSMDVLKGATAAALYGARGGNGAIIIVTKKGADSKGLTVTVNSNTMFAAGFLALPKVQTAYSAGLNGNYSPTDYVWGARLDAGVMADQWNPLTKQMENAELTSKGKNNLQHFLEPGLVTNNNVSVAQTGEHGSFRASLSHVYNKGQYPNAKLNMTTFTLGGELKVSDKFTMESHMGYNKRITPQVNGKGYNDQGYIYNLLMWTGPEYDIRDYRDYWLVPHEKQNWNYNAWYDNPYLMAYEKLNGIDQNMLNASLSASYKIFKGAKLMLRSGLDYYNNNETKRNPIGINATRGWNAKGMYMKDNKSGYSINNDLLFSIERKVGDFNIDGLAGGTIYFLRDERLKATTRNGISVPGFYSLAASVERPDVDFYTYKKQVNSLFGKVTVNWKNKIFADVTGRNDWTSTLPAATRSYFYPSVGSSVVMSEFIKLPNWFDFWKVRGSWAVSKVDLGIYANNTLYNTTVGDWGGNNSASYPRTIINNNIKPRTERTWEVGTAAYFMKKRLRADVTYYNKYIYNVQQKSLISQAAGFDTALVNINETYVRRGLEVTLDATPVQRKNFQWDVTLNWSASHQYYKSLDAVRSKDNLWTRVGSRTDAYADTDWLKDGAGNLIIRGAGLPVRSDYQSRLGYKDPSWVWGLTNSFRYRNFTFTVGLDGRVGGILYNYIYDKLWDTGSHPDSDNSWRYDEVVNKNKSFVADGVKIISGSVDYDKYGNILKDDRVYAANDKNVSYQMYARKFRGGTAAGTQDATFIKVRELSVAYRVPAALARRVGARSAAVALTGQNVFLWTKAYKFADPDGASDDVTSPAVRYVGVDFKLTF